MGKGVLDSRLRMDQLLRDDVDYERPKRGGAELFDLVELRGRVVLDIGCGHGPYRREVESRGGRWVGLDLSGPGPMVIGDGMSLPFRAGAFDAVLCAAVLEHVPDPPAFMGELRRVLRSGGDLFGYVAFLEPFHGISYYHMSHMGVEYLFLTTGFAPKRIFPPSVGMAFQLETLLFTKPVPGLQPIVRWVLRTLLKLLLYANRLAREVLMLLRRLPASQRERERRQYRQLLSLRYAVGLNFIAERVPAESDGSASEARLDRSGYRAMLREG